MPVAGKACNNGQSELQLTRHLAERLPAFVEKLLLQRFDLAIDPRGFNSCSLALAGRAILIVVFCECRDLDAEYIHGLRHKSADAFSAVRPELV